MHNLLITEGADKENTYRQLIPQVNSLIAGEQDLIANLANISAILYQTFNWWWVGFYLVKENELVLGPFQGPPACTRIGFGKGVCGTAWKKQESLYVPDVNLFPGHIACSSQSVSEIVVPVFNMKNEVAGVLDVDSDRYDVLDQTDVYFLNQLVQSLIIFF